MGTVAERGAPARRHDMHVARRPKARRSRAAIVLVGVALTAGALLSFGASADAAIVPTVVLGPAAKYAVLGHETVTNTGDSTLDRSLGLWPGTEITGFPPGIVNPPGTTDTTNIAAQDGQAALTAAYVNAKGRSVSATTTADLANLELQAGVYSGPNKSALGLTGPLVLDGAGNLDSVFIFQTNSTLITDSSTTITLINGAQECNVFWQVGSSATLGSSSVFRGNILAQISITVNNSVTVHGRALARTGAVTLDTDTFTHPTCERAAATPTTTTTTAASAPTTPTTGIGNGGGSGGGGSGGGTPGVGTPGVGTPGVTSSTTTVPGVPRVTGPPRTGAAPMHRPESPWTGVIWGVLALGVVTSSLMVVRRSRVRTNPIAKG